MLAVHTHWTNANLKGMETSFLMSTILRIGSLMKVGFGAAGVQIIRGSLRKNSKSSVSLRQQASTVSCIFLFCDIRQFTDASECLQEEVFLFTNKIAAVVHSICHSYGGFANKNIGDAFLLSWKLEDATGANFYNNEVTTQNKEADKALLSVIQICIALCHEDFFLADISDTARNKLKDKFDERPGNLVQVRVPIIYIYIMFELCCGFIDVQFFCILQLGFGLHAGMAVEGAIGSARKLDATYLSNEVELAEFLESSTKKYGVVLLMSGSFYQLLHNSNQRRCRQIDEAFFSDELDEYDEDLCEIEDQDSETHMRLFTYDIDLEPLKQPRTPDRSEPQGVENHSSSFSVHSSREEDLGASYRKNLFQRSFTKQTKGSFISGRRLSILSMRQPHDPNVSERMVADLSDEVPQRKIDHLVLPTGPMIYHSKLWKDPDILAIRHHCTAQFFHNFQVGFAAYLEGNWFVARTKFQFMVDRYKDKPSAVLLEKMKKSNYIPPNYFRIKLGRE